jgi:retinol dehydrogenase 12
MTDDTLEHRTFLVTGANSGIGRALVEALAGRGASVILAARSTERTDPVLKGIRTRYPRARATFLHLDLADLQSVREAAERVLETEPSLDVLVNNAGVAGTHGLSRDGFDLTYAINHLGPFLFTNLLLPRLTQSSAARIVNVASIAHLRVRQLDWSLLERRSAARQSGFVDYAATKLMNVIHAKELARRLTGTSVRTTSLHPGGVATHIWRALPQPLQWVLKLFLLSSEEGARTPLYCATAPELDGVSGRYYAKCREARCNRLADDTALGAELWARSERAVGRG